MREIKDDKPGTAGVPACRRREEPTTFIRVAELIDLGSVRHGRRGCLRSQHDVLAQSSIARHERNN